MRAQTVNFEKGIDPKKSMDIGINPFKVEEIYIGGVKIKDDKWLDSFLKKDLPLFIKTMENPNSGADISFKENSEDETQKMLYSIFRQGYDGIYYKGKYYPFKPRTFESLNFEKGIDPKKAMGIGEEATYQKIADMMQKDGWTPADPHESDSAIGWAVEYGHHDLAKFLLDRHAHQDEVQNQMVNYIQWSAQNRNLDMLELLLSYYNIDPSHLNFALRMASSYEPAYNLIKNYMSKTNESLEFERGKDPKRALNIGLGKYSLENSSFPMINDEIIKSAISEIMELPPEKIYFMGDTRGEEIDYLNRLADYVYSLDRIDNLEIETGEWIGTLELYDLDEGKICVFEDHAHAEFFGDIIAFEEMKTREHLIV